MESRISKVVNTAVKVDDPQRMDKIKQLGVQARRLDNPVGRAFVAVVDRLAGQPVLSTREAVEIIMRNIL